jgi:hypothetical protein
MVMLVAVGMGVQAWGAAPPIVSGPVVQGVGATWVSVKWVTGEAEGPTTTLTADLGATGNPQLANCTPFPAGATIRIGREHAYVEATGSGACTLSVTRGWDARSLRIWEGTLVSITASGGVCTAATSMPHLYQVGDFILVQRASGIPSSTRTVASTPAATTFTFACAGVANGVYNQAGIEIFQVAGVHASGTVVQRIDSDARLCVGTSPGNYTQSFRPNDRTDWVAYRNGSINHQVTATALTPNTTYYARVMSTPRSSGASDCGQPWPDTAVSAEFSFTTAALDWEPQMPSAAAKTWGFHVANLTYATDVLAAADCSDLQAKINQAAAADGSQNHRIRIPAGAQCVLPETLVLPAKSGANADGAGRLVLTTEAHASLPPEGVRIRPELHGGLLPQVASAALETLYVAPGASYWVVRGLQLTVNPALAYMGREAAVVSSLVGAPEEYDVAKEPHHIVFEQNWVRCPEWNNYCRGGLRLHGDYLVVEANDIGPVNGFTDLGAVQVDGLDTQYVYIHNNRLVGAMSGLFISDGGTNQRDIWVERNLITKPESWNARNWRHQFKVSQGVASVVNGSSTTINTAQQNAVNTGTPVAFSGATGAWEGINARVWSVLEGTLGVTVSGGVATVTTSTPHGLSTGQRVSVGGGYRAPCSGINTTGGSVAVTVTGPTTFTFNTSAGNFSTVAGEQCPHSDLRVVGPVWAATKVDNDTFTVAFNSTGLGALSGEVNIHYPMASNLKNTLELKQGRRVYIGGNIIENSWAQNQSGWLIALTPRAGDYQPGSPIMQGGPEHCWWCNSGITDVTVENNLLRDGCTVLDVLGANDYGVTLPLQRVRMRNNLAYGVSEANTSGMTCHRAFGVLIGGHEALELSHNTVETGAYGVSGRPFEVSDPKSPAVRIRDNIVTALVAPSNGACNWAGLVEGKGCANWSWRSWEQGRNVYYGDFRIRDFADPWGNMRQFMAGPSSGTPADYTANFWPESQGHIGWQGHRAITGCTNTAPIVCTSSTAHGLATGDQVTVTGVGGNTNANGHWFVRVLNATQFVLAGSIGNGNFSGDFGGQASLMPLSVQAANFDAWRLVEASPYRAGRAYVAPAGPPGYGTAGQGAATDNRDIGADTAQVRAATGAVAFQGVQSSGGGAQFLYTVYAGDGETCYLDLSSDGFATFTRTADSGMGVERSTFVGNLNAGTNYQFRLLCPSASLQGSYTAGVRRR